MKINDNVFYCLKNDLISCSKYLPLMIVCLANLSLAVIYFLLKTNRLITSMDKHF